MFPSCLHKCRRERARINSWSPDYFLASCSLTRSVLLLRFAEGVPGSSQPPAKRLADCWQRGHASLSPTAPL